MKLIEDNRGVQPGETRHIPVCSKCGCRTLFKMQNGHFVKVRLCPKCGHVIDWKGGSGDGK